MSTEILSQGFKSIQKLCSAGDSSRTTTRTMCGTFDLKNKRSNVLPLEEYMQRLYQHSECSPGAILAHLVLMHRLSQKGVVVTSQNVHRFLLASLVVSIKLNDDRFFSNGYYAAVGCTTLAELNRMEEQFLNLMKWDIIVSASETGMVFGCQRGTPLKVVRARRQIQEM